MNYAVALIGRCFRTPRCTRILVPCPICPTIPSSPPLWSHRFVGRSPTPPFPLDLMSSLHTSVLRAATSSNRRRPIPFGATLCITWPPDTFPPPRRQLGPTPQLTACTIVCCQLSLSPVCPMYHPTWGRAFVSATVILGPIAIWHMVLCRRPLLSLFPCPSFRCSSSPRCTSFCSSPRFLAVPRTRPIPHCSHVEPPSVDCTIGNVAVIVEC